MPNKNNVYRIVITGGPCSGKTTGFSHIKSMFENDFIIYRIPEIATMSIESGVNIIPTNYNNEQHRALTLAICQH